MGIKPEPENNINSLLDGPDLITTGPGAVLIVTTSPLSVVSQLHDMAHYLSGDGYPGFLAWIRQHNPDIEIPGDAIHSNLQNLLNAVHKYGGSHLT